MEAAAAAAAAAKPARTARGSEPDLLSALSDELLCHVLSFLPSRQAVQTTVLSKRWVDLWRSVASVSISTEDFEGGTSTAGRYCWRRMRHFTNNLLMLNTARRLDAFRLELDFCGSTDSPNSCRDIESWVCRGIKCQPLELQIEVCLSYRNRYHFQIPLLGSGFQRLKSLELAGVILDRGFSERLSSGCPALQDLILHDCDNNFDVIQSDTLRNLVVGGCRGRVADTLVVRAPCLASVSIDCCRYIRSLSLEAANSLVKASISATPAHSSPTTEAILLGSLSSVTFLELKFFQPMALLDDSEFDKFPMFDNLRTLSLGNCSISEWYDDNFKALGRFLRKSQNLEELILQEFWVQPVVGPIEFPVLENLRTLAVEWCELRDNFHLLRHLLRSSPNLEKLTVWGCLELPEVSMGWKTCPQFGDLVPFQCPKLKSTEIIYYNGDKIQGLVSFLLDVSDSATENTITLTKR